MRKEEPEREDIGQTQKHRNPFIGCQQFLILGRLAGMKYMTDAHVSGLAKELRSRSIDCETVHKLILNNEHSEVKIEDPKIIEFLRAQDKQITPITLDTELSEYCRIDGIPCIRVQDLVADYIKRSTD